MPELPEVENIRRTLTHDLKKDPVLKAIQYHRGDLRFPIPKKELDSLTGSKLLEISRRGKYLLFQFTNGVMISHLGMTGQWIVESKKYLLKKHDHLDFTFDNGIQLIYNDPRRFGYVDFIDKLEKLPEHPLFSHLGLEPFSKNMNAEYLQAKAVKSSRAVKTFLMDQAIVVGVGNIYASEVLFKAQVKPQRLAKKVSLAEWQKIAQAIKAVLKLAIEKGGSTIRDYRRSDGTEGSFQKYFLVYDRAGEPCKKCGAVIRSVTLGGRATYWCPQCQK